MTKVGIVFGMDYSVSWNQIKERMDKVIEDPNEKVAFAVIDTKMNKEFEKYCDELDDSTL